MLLPFYFPTIFNRNLCNIVNNLTYILAFTTTLTMYHTCILYLIVILIRSLKANLQFDICEATILLFGIGIVVYFFLDHLFNVSFLLYNNFFIFLLSATCSVTKFFCFYDRLKYVPVF
jgi:hypothetical protein